MGASNFQDNVSGMRPAASIPPQQVTATISGTGIDVSNTSNNASTSALTFVVSTGADAALDGSNFFTLSFEKAADSGFSAPVAVPAEDIFGAQRISDLSDWDLLLNAAADSDNTFKVGVRMNDSTRPFYRPVLTETGTADLFVAIAGVTSPDLQPE